MQVPFCPKCERELTQLEGRRGECGRCFGAIEFREKKGKKIDVGKIVRGIARERVGQPKAGKVVPDKRRKKLDKIRQQELREDER